MRTAAAFLDLQGTPGGVGFGDIRDVTFFPWEIPAIGTLNDAGLPAIDVVNATNRVRRGEAWAELSTGMDATRAGSDPPW